MIGKSWLRWCQERQSWQTIPPIPQVLTTVFWSKWENSSLISAVEQELLGPKLSIVEVSCTNEFHVGYRHVCTAIWFFLISPADLYQVRCVCPAPAVWSTQLWSASQQQPEPVKLWPLLSCSMSWEPVHMWREVTAALANWSRVFPRSLLTHLM